MIGEGKESERKDVDMIRWDKTEMLFDWREKESRSSYIRRMDFNLILSTTPKAPSHIPARNGAFEPILNT